MHRPVAYPQKNRENCGWTEVAFSHSPKKVLSCSLIIQPLLSSTVIYYYTERSIYKAEKCSYPSIDQNTRPFFLMFTKMGYGNTTKWLNGGEDNTKDRSTMLDNQLTNGQHKSMSRKNNFNIFLPSSEPYPVLPSITTQFHSLPRIFPLSFRKGNMLTNKINNRYKEKTLHGSVTYSHPNTFAERNIYPGVCRTITE